MTVHRFSVDQYHRLGETGILDEEDRVELLEGWIVSKMVRNPPHDLSLELLDAAIRPLVPPGWRVRTQMAITTADSEPEPDLAIVEGAPRSRLPRHPGPQETGFIAEVSDSSLARDRGTKARLYARASIETYWIVNLIARQIEVHASPSGDQPEPLYRSVRVYSEGEKVPLLLGGVLLGEIAVSDVLA